MPDDCSMTHRNKEEYMIPALKEIITLNKFLKNDLISFISCEPLQMSKPLSHLLGRRPYDFMPCRLEGWDLKCTEPSFNLWPSFSDCIFWHIEHWKEVTNEACSQTWYMSQGRSIARDLLGFLVELVACPAAPWGQSLGYYIPDPSGWWLCPLLGTALRGRTFNFILLCNHLQCETCTHLSSMYTAHPHGSKHQASNALPLKGASANGLPGTFGHKHSADALILSCVSVLTLRTLAIPRLTKNALSLCHLPSFSSSWAFSLPVLSFSLFSLPKSFLLASLTALRLYLPLSAVCIRTTPGPPPWVLEVSLILQHSLMCRSSFSLTIVWYFRVLSGCSWGPHSSPAPTDLLVTWDASQPLYLGCPHIPLGLVLGDHDSSLNIDPACLQYLQ